MIVNMAVRKVRSEKQKVKTEVLEPDFSMTAAAMPEESKPKTTVNKKWVWIAAIVGVLLAWWWKTNTWPIVAFVGGQPITRYEVNKALWNQSGEVIMDSLITQKLVEMELDSLGVSADQDKVNSQLETMKASIPEGSTWEQELASSGFSEKQIRQQIELFTRINKAVEAEATVSASEVEEYVKTNGEFLSGANDEEKKTQAEQILKDEKTGTAIQAWIAKVREDGNSKIWRVGASQ